MSSSTFFSQLSQQLWQQPKLLLRQYRLESLWALLFSLPFLVLNLELFEKYDLREYWLFAPACFVLSYLCQPQRRLYWLTAAVPLLLICGQTAFGLSGHQYLQQPQFWTFQLLLLFALLTHPWTADNRTFIGGVLKTVLSIGWALLVSLLCFAIGFALLSSIEFLFDLNLSQADTVLRLYLATLFGLFPLFFLLFEHRQRQDEIAMNHISQLVMNLILSPTLIIYTLILYLYTLRIVMLDELPQGQISFIVLPYLLLGLWCKAMLNLAEQPKWQRFYRLFGWLALLPLALLWIAVYQRLNHYGLTETRIYLLTSVIVISLLIGLSLFQATTRYRTFALLLAAAILLVGGIINPAQIASENQLARFENQLRQLDLLNSDGKLKPLSSMPATLSEQQQAALRDQAIALQTTLQNNTLDARYAQLVSQLLEVDAESAVAGEHEMIFWDFTEPKITELKRTYRKMLTLHYPFGNVMYNKRDCNESSEHLFYFAELGMTDFKIDFNAMINKILLDNGLELKKRYSNAELEPLNKQFLLMEVDNSLLKFSSLTLCYDQDHGYVFQSAILDLLLQ